MSYQWAVSGQIFMEELFWKYFNWNLMTMPLSFVWLCNRWYKILWISTAEKTQSSVMLTEKKKKLFREDLVNYFAYLWQKKKKEEEKSTVIAHYVLNLSHKSTVLLCLLCFSQTFFCVQGFWKSLKENWCYLSCCKPFGSTAVYQPGNLSQLGTLSISCNDWNKRTWLVMHHMHVSQFLLRSKQTKI